MLLSRHAGSAERCFHFYVGVTFNDICIVFTCWQDVTTELALGSVGHAYILA